MLRKTIAFLLITILILTLSGCQSPNNGNSSNATGEIDDVSGTNSSFLQRGNNTSTENANQSFPELEIKFGENSKTFTLELYENETAREIAKEVGTADWNLPIYNFDGYEDSEFMQYYDISNRAEIPSNTEQIDSELIGEVYYSHPNRIILFYQDAQIPGEYTPVGRITDTTGLTEAVNNNPVVEGWNNKIVSISIQK